MKGDSSKNFNIICLNPGVVDSNRLAMTVNSRASQEGGVFSEFPNFNSDRFLTEICIFFIEISLNLTFF